MDKIIEYPKGVYQGDSFLVWAEFYYYVHVKRSPLKTEQAKQRDLTKFLNFVAQEVGHDPADS
jgi:integrase/recombinase XerD